MFLNSLMEGVIYPRIIGRRTGISLYYTTFYRGFQIFLMGGAIYPRIIGRGCWNFYCDEGC